MNIAIGLGENHVVHTGMRFFFFFFLSSARPSPIYYYRQAPEFSAAEPSRKLP